jgi:hypothetical protein
MSSPSHTHATFTLKKGIRWCRWSKSVLSRKGRGQRPRPCRWTGCKIHRRSKLQGRVCSKRLPNSRCVLA